jgi:subtilase family serine protease
MIRFVSALSGPFILFVLAVSTVVASAPASPPAARLITQGIDPARTVELHGNVRPEAANARNDRGPAPADFPLSHLLLQLRRPAEREAALAALIEQQQDPASPNYRNWIDAEQFGVLYGPAQPDVDTIVTWLQAQGFNVDRVYESGMTIAFSGTAGLVRKALGADIHFLDVDGQMHYANIGNPRIPAALADAVAGVVALHDFRPRPQLQPKAAPDYTISGSELAVVPADLATIYNLAPLFAAGNKGQGITIALIEDTDVYSTADITTFRSVFGIGAATFTQAHPGCTDPGAVIGRDAEATLDVEWAAAAAPGATLQLVSCPGLIEAITNLVNANATPPAIMSVSYGQCEALLGTAENTSIASAYQQAVVKGISVFVASGDEGAAGCDAGASQSTHGIGVNGLASTPYNVAVGGTDFGDTFAHTSSTYWNNTNAANYGSAKSYINEIPWNNSCASQLIASSKGFAQSWGASGFCNAASGANFLTVVSAGGGPSGCSSGTPSANGVVGGSCAGWAKPSWQSGLFGNPGDGVRDLPDVSLFAANGVWNHYYVYCFSDPRQDPANNNAVYGTPCIGAPSNWSGAGGTSFSAPILAGIQALVNQKNGASLGNPNPAYYALAAAEYGASGNASCNSSNGNGVGSSCTFYDVTQGDMDINCASGSPGCYRPTGTNGVLSTSTVSYLPAFRATSGWDFATGIGTLNAANLVANWPLATQVQFTTEPANGVTGSALAPIVVSVENASGTVVSGNTSAVTLKFASNPTGATLGGTLTRSAVNGVATFGNITVNKAGNGYTLTATDGSLSNDTSAPFNIVSSAPAKLAFTTQPPSTAQSGASFGVGVSVQDAAGNTVVGNSSSVTLVLTTPAGATLSGTTTKAASAGVAAFSGLSIDKAGTYTLTASDGTLTSAVSTSITISHGAAAKLAFTSPPPASVATGAGFGAVVTVQDAAGNAVTGNSSQVSVALTTANGATLNGNKSVAASNGVATFSGLSVAQIGSYSLTATDSALAPATSSAFAITPGAAASIVFTTQPVSPLAGAAFGVAVSVQDSLGNVETGDGTTQITLSTNVCGNSVLRTVTVSAGVAQFPNLRFYTPGNSRQLSAQASISLVVNSTPFTVQANPDLIFADAFATCTP